MATRTSLSPSFPLQEKEKVIVPCLRVEVLRRQARGTVPSGEQAAQHEAALLWVLE